MKFLYVSDEVGIQRNTPSVSRVTPPAPAKNTTNGNTTAMTIVVHGRSETNCPSETNFCWMNPNRRTRVCDRRERNPTFPDIKDDLRDFALIKYLFKRTFPLKFYICQPKMITKTKLCRQKIHIFKHIFFLFLFFHKLSFVLAVVVRRDVCRCPVGAGAPGEGAERSKNS